MIRATTTDRVKVVPCWMVEYEADVHDVAVTEPRPGVFAAAIPDFQGLGPITFTTADLGPVVGEGVRRG